MSQKLIMLFAVLMMILPLNAQRNRKSGENAVFYPVSRIVDGDTFWIDDGSEKGIKIRLTGIDAPETRNSRNRVKSAFGEESTRYLTGLIAGKRACSHCSLRSKGKRLGPSSSVNARWLLMKKAGISRPFSLDAAGKP